MTESLKFDLCMAPIRGLTDHLFRSLYAEMFGGMDRAMAPFVVTVMGKRVKPAHLDDLSHAEREKLPLVPQVLGADPVRLGVMLRALRAMGFKEVNLNAGCPHPDILSHGHGAALLNDAATLRRMLEVGTRWYPGAFSVKLRLGVERKQTACALAPMLNDFPLAEVILHPRTAVQRYDGEVDNEGFGAFLARCSHPVVYNGDICSLAGFQRLQDRFPGVDRWMLGRGLPRNPFLPAELRGSELPGAESAKNLVGKFSEIFFRTCRCVMPVEAALGRAKHLTRYMKDGRWLSHQSWRDLCRIRDERDFFEWIRRVYGQKTFS